MNNLTSAETYVLQLVAAVNANHQVPPVPEASWPQVLAELKAQAITAYPSDSIDHLALTPAETSDYLQNAATSLMHWHAVMAAQAQIAQLFAAAHIPVAVLKGAAAAQHYPRPDLRAMGDIDLIVRPQDMDAAYHLMTDNGWHSDLAPKGEAAPAYAAARHIDLHKKGCPVVELHRSFGVGSSQATSSQAASDALDHMIFAALPYTQTLTLEGYAAPILPPLENGLVLLAHLNRHLTNGGVGLRQLIDWQQYVEAHLDDSFWRSTFQPAAQRIGLQRLAQIAALACHRHLGLQRQAAWFTGAAAPAPALTPNAAPTPAPNPKDVQLADQLIAYVVRFGNFGTKEDHGGVRTRWSLRMLSNPVTALKYLYSSGVSNWPAAQKHGWLKPLAPFYQAGRLVGKGLGRNAGTAEILKDAAKSKQEKAFLKNIGAL